MGSFFLYKDRVGIKYLSNKKNTNTNKCASLFWLSLFFLFHFVYVMALHILVELYMDIFFLSLVQSMGFGLDDIQCRDNNFSSPRLIRPFPLHLAWVFPAPQSQWSGDGARF